MKTEIEILWTLAANRERQRRQAEIASEHQDLQAEVIRILMAILKEYRPEVAEMCRLIMEREL